MSAYDSDAEAFAEQYEQVDFEQIHGHWLDVLPTEPGDAIDIGAGSGRDAAALAARGWKVVAVEPSALGAIGARIHAGAGIRWLQDRLPLLSSVSGAFDLLLINAVWMHIPVDDAARAFDRVVELARPGAVLVIGVRDGCIDRGRNMRLVPPAELVDLAAAAGLTVCRVLRTDDQMGRTGLRWRKYVLRK